MAGRAIGGVALSLVGIEGGGTSGGCRYLREGGGGVHVHIHLQLASKKFPK